MAGVAYNLKKIFSRDLRPDIQPFKQYHYLNCLSRGSLTDMLQFLEHQHLLRMIPALKDKKVLLLSMGHRNYLLEKLSEQKPELFVYYRLDDSGHTQTEQAIIVSGELKSLSLKSDFFDICIAPMADFAGHFSSHLSEISRVLKHHGTLICSLPHSILQCFLTNQNPASSKQLSEHLQDYFLNFRAQDLYLENLSEALVDKKVRSFFVTPTGEDYYDDYQGIPLVLFMALIKFNWPSEK